jgi:2Fe-2S ferredoxin
MPRITFVNDGRVVSAVEGSTLLAAALSGEVPIGHTCGGEGSCSTCRVAVLSGAENLSPINLNEVAYCLGPGERLACQAHLTGDVAVRVLEVPKAEIPSRADAS